MQCNCGYDNNEGMRHCVRCGKELVPLEAPPRVETQSAVQAQSVDSVQPPQGQPQQQSFQTPASPQTVQAPPGVPEYQIPRTHSYQQLGGFLLVIVVLGIIGLFLSVIQFPSDLASREWLQRSFIEFGSPLSASLYSSITLFEILQTICEALTLVCIFKKNKHLITTVAASVLLGILSMIVIVISVAMVPDFTGTQMSQVLGMLIPAAIFGILLSLLYLLYFFKSVRLRTYMGSDAYITQGPWKFANAPIPAIPDPPVRAA